jgi:hypothetical protein
MIFSYSLLPFRLSVRSINLLQPAENLFLISYVLPTRVTTPSTEHILITKHFSTIMSFPYLNWEIFVSLDVANWRATNVLWESEVKEQCTKHRKRMSDSSLRSFWKNNSRPLSSSSLISSLFLNPFWEIKNLMGASTRALQNFWSKNLSSKS